MAPRHSKDPHLSWLSDQEFADADAWMTRQDRAKAYLVKIHMSPVFGREYIRRLKIERRQEKLRADTEAVRQRLEQAELEKARRASETHRARVAAQAPWIARSGIRIDAAPTRLPPMLT